MAFRTQFGEPRPDDHEMDPDLLADLLSRGRAAAKDFDSTKADRLGLRRESPGRLVRGCGRSGAMAR